MNKILLVFLILITPCLFAEGKFTLTINPPQVSDAYSDLIDQVVAVSESIKNDIIEEISPYIEKPQLLSAFANAISFAKPQSSTSTYTQPELFTFNIGSQIAIKSFSLKSEELINTLESFDIEEDTDFGAGFHPLVCQLNIRINQIPGIFLIGLQGGFYKIKFFDFKLLSVNAGINANYRFLDSLFPKSSLFKWQGLLISSGINFNYNKIDTSMSLDPFSETFTFDPDGDGPIFPQPGQIYLEPKVNVGIRAWVFTIPLELSTCINFVKIFNLAFGCALDFQFGSSSLFFDANTSVNLQGSLATYQEEEGSATFSGDLSDGKPDLAKFRIFLVPGLIIGPMQFDLPISYYFKNGVAAGILMGFKL